MELRDQLTELRRAMKEAKERRMYERYQAVFLYLSGHKMEEVAQITGRTRKTVGGYVAAYRKGGLEALTPLRPSGRPPRLSPEQEEQLVAVVANQLPSEAGLGPFANWTLDLMIAYVKREWGVRYSQRGMSLLLERLGLSYTRPTYTLARADPEKQRVFREETFPRLKKN